MKTPTPKDYKPQRARDRNYSSFTLGPFTVVSKLWRLLCMLAAAVALLLIAYWLERHPDFNFPPLSRSLSFAAMGLAGILTLYVYIALISRTVRSRREGPSFLDIDRSPRRPDVADDRLDAIVAEIRRLASTVTSGRIDVEAIIEQVKQTRAELAPPPLPPDSFQAQMAQVVRVLEDKAKLSDEKASVLLDRGVAYSKFGIGFFIIAIIVWQALAWWKGLETQLIFGIASSTVLFVFLQFLSSWFLKQYRHFVEVSTYLIEIKSVFDRYALLYMLVRDVGSKEAADAGPVGALVLALKEEMKWPRARPAFTDDVYYAKDAVGATEEIVKIVRMSTDAKEAPKPK